MTQFPNAPDFVGVEAAFGPGLFGGLVELPAVEARAEGGSDGLGLAGAGVVAEVVVGEAEGFGEQPAGGERISRAGARRSRGGYFLTVFVGVQCVCNR